MSDTARMTAAARMAEITELLDKVFQHTDVLRRDVPVPAVHRDRAERLHHEAGRIHNRALALEEAHERYSGRRS